MMLELGAAGCNNLEADSEDVLLPGIDRLYHIGIIFSKQFSCLIIV